MTSEFNFIKQYLYQRQAQRRDVDLALGDDCALVSVPTGYQIAISTDTLVQGTHFLADAKPEAVAYKALMSNISDLAAMGATPAWLSMALTLPYIDQVWLTPFLDQLFELADAHQLQLIGGDTTQGPLSISFTIHGVIPQGQALTRQGAQVGDKIIVSGCLGDSHAGLSILLNEAQGHSSFSPHASTLIERHFYAQSRIALGEALRGKATSCIDISDGLIADLGHILKQSMVQANININALPISSEVLTYYGDKTAAQKTALKSGEEYELCFTMDETQVKYLPQLAQQLGCALTCIGEIMEIQADRPQIQLYQDDDPDFYADSSWPIAGYDHFK